MTVLLGSQGSWPDPNWWRTISFQWPLAWGVSRKTVPHTPPPAVVPYTLPFRPRVTPPQGPDPSVPVKLCNTLYSGAPRAEPQRPSTVTMAARGRVRLSLHRGKGINAPPWPAAGRAGTGFPQHVPLWNTVALRLQPGQQGLAYASACRLWHFNRFRLHRCPGPTGSS